MVTRVYLFKSRGFVCANKFAEYLLKQKIKGLGTLQDCLDWTVYAPYIDLVLDLTFDQNPTISYGYIELIDSASTPIYFFDPDDYEYYLQTNQDKIKESNWLESVKLIK
jgi:hypothetical protein